MSEPLKQAIVELTKQLEEQEAQVAETKKLINSLHLRVGEPAPYGDVSPTTISRTQIRPDAFYGQKFATSVETILRARGHAMPVSEIISTLRSGGYNFRGKIPERSVPITLGKNTAKFASIPNTDSFGLREWYPDLREKTKRVKGSEENENGDGDDNDAVPLESKGGTA